MLSENNNAPLNISRTKENIRLSEYSCNWLH